VRHSTGSRLRGWKVTCDGTFWAGVLTFGCVGSLLVAILMATHQF
jgi:hypothetical protein